MGKKVVQWCIYKKTAGVPYPGSYWAECKSERHARKELAEHHEVDFWPGTGLWIVRGEQQRWRGVRKLLAFVE